VQLHACGLHLPGTSPDYGFPWFVRSIWTIEHCAGALAIGAIGAAGDTFVPSLNFPLENLGRIFPDQNAWATLLSQVAPTVGKFGTLAGYSGPPYLLTMYMCIFGTKDIVQFSPAQLALKQDELVTARCAFKQKYGINQKPSNLVMSVLMPTR
jgi:hypothetical protein